MFIPYRALAALPVVCLGLSIAGCRSSASSNYEEVQMPLQTGSVLHRRTEVPKGPETKKKKPEPEKEKEKEKAKEKPRKKPEPEASATPAPEEESTPPPERFR